MTVYALKTRRPEVDYFADIINPTTGGTIWAHVRTNLGRKVAYAMFARHFEGYKIAAFRDCANADDREGIKQGSDGILRDNPFAGYSTRAESQLFAR